MRETWLALIPSIPSADATLVTFLAETPHVAISDTAAIMARPTREQRTGGSSGKQDPRLSLGILGAISPTEVTSLRP